MKKLSLILALTLMGACHDASQDAANQTLAVDENLTSSAMDEPTSLVPTDPCGRNTQLGEDGKFYTVNPDGTLSPGIVQGIWSKEECKKLIKSNNGSSIVRVATDFSDAEMPTPK